MDVRGTYLGHGALFFLCFHRNHARTRPHLVGIGPVRGGGLGAEEVGLGLRFEKIGAANIKDGYGLDGTPMGSSNALAFVGPAGAGALAGPASTLTRDAYTRVKAVSRLAAGSAYAYYDASWGVLSLLLMTGNLADFTAPP